MSEEIIHLDNGVIKQELKEFVRNSAEETLNKLLDQKASELLKADRHERTKEREGYRAGHYERNLTTTSGNMKLKMPKLKGMVFETAIIERYCRVREFCRRSDRRDAPCRYFSSTCVGYRRGSLKGACFWGHWQRVGAESLRAYRDMAAAPSSRFFPVCLFGWDLPQA